MKRVGLLFGTFDPIHNGHVKLAEKAVFQKMVDEVWLVVTPENPFKKNKIITDKHHRLEMVQIATKFSSNLIPSDIEFNLSPPNYTSITLKHLNAEYINKYDFFMIMGWDNYVTLLNQKWKDSIFILNNFKIITYNRLVKPSTQINVLSPALIDEYRKSYDPLHIQIKGSLMPISSSMIRKIIIENKDVISFFLGADAGAKLLPQYQLLYEFMNKDVLKYIQKNNLYIH